mgnify:CR=1 FL=1
MRKGDSYLPVRDFPNIELYWAANEEYYQAQKLLIEALDASISFFHSFIGCKK